MTETTKKNIMRNNIVLFPPTEDRTVLDTVRKLNVKDVTYKRQKHFFLD